jgi:tripartite-type tricarboxylate transporter receptor subunit TctC
MATAGFAQDYPASPVTIIVPVSTGGPMDMLGRLVAAELSDRWGQPFIVENRPGGGQSIATNYVANAEPDGYTLLLMGHVFTMNPWLFDDLPYEMDDLAPITQLSDHPLIMSVNPSLPVESVEEFIAYAAERPGELSFGSSGPSSSLRFASELMMFETGIDMVHIPYPGNGPMTVALASGEIDMAFVNPVSASFIEDGSIQAIAISSANRSEGMPDLPTVAETLPGFSAGSWFGLMAPSGTPEDILEKLNVEVLDILRKAEVIETLTEVEATPVGRSREGFVAYIDSELEKWRVLIDETGLTLN